ncbi:MAG TPA: 16S rRNA (guanine(966)-N(2))-methyltransferase RsmD [Dehalococcoidia bacterium]|nr:16S rRNA (guanine(966)-N(2))-methyltransferase RsmD [Dehalococcoidia bacterium]
MRIIAGTARGRTLAGPRNLTTRPTSDKVRGAIFSMLEARGASFSHVLDLYAGTGALGIEALSRGAEFAEFVERERGACAVIAENLRRSGLEAAARVHCAALPAALGRVNGPFGLIFCDPPYADASVAETLERLRSGRELDASSTIVYEHGRRTMPPDACGGLPRRVTRRHGDTSVTLYYLDKPNDDNPDGDATEGEDIDDCGLSGPV